MRTSATGRGAGQPERGAAGTGGFTLLEVVLAVALLGLLLTALVEGLSRGTSAVTALAERTALVTAAANQSTLLEAGVEPGTSGLGSEPNLTWRWSPPLTGAAGPGEPGRLTVSRYRPAGGGETSFTLFTWAGGYR